MTVSENQTTKSLGRHDFQMNKMHSLEEVNTHEKLRF